MLHELLSFFTSIRNFPTILTFSQHTSKKDLPEKKARTKLSHTIMGASFDTPLAEWLSAHARARANSDCA